MKALSLWTLILAVSVGGASFLKHGAHSFAGGATAPDSVTAAYRDGAYLGNLSAKRGDASHVSVGRWAEESDRKLFAIAYERAYGLQMSQRHSGSRDTDNIVTNQDGNAAFRDGVYVGKLDATRGGAMHLAVGRWSTANDRAAFMQGYSQSFDPARSANLVLSSRSPLAQ